MKMTSIAKKCEKNDSKIKKTLDKMCFFMYNN